MIKNGHSLPEPVDGRTPHRNTPEWQLRRLNRIASALWEARPLLGDDDRFAISVNPDRADVQVDIHVHQPAELADALALVERLGWDVEQNRVRVGMAHHHRWHGTLGGYRAYVVWIEQPAAVDTQGRDDLPADVGIGNRQADAEEAQRLTALASAGSGFGSTGPGQ